MLRNRGFDMLMYTVPFLLLWLLLFIWSDAKAYNAYQFCAIKDRLICETQNGALKACFIKQYGDDWFIDLSSDPLEPSTTFINSNSCQFVSAQ